MNLMFHLISEYKMNAIIEISELEFKPLWNMNYKKNVYQMLKLCDMNNF